MGDMGMQIEVLGARGSNPVFGKQYMEFGGSTSCFRVTAGKNVLYLDAGSGMSHAPSPAAPEAVILLSHVHLDHVIGLPNTPEFNSWESKVKIYIPGGTEAISTLFNPPYWPLGLTDFPGDVEMLPLPVEDTTAAEASPLLLPPFTITSIPGNHPNGCRIFKLTDGTDTVIYATDYEHSEEHNKTLIAFAAGADCLIYDGAYDSTEYAFFKGYGHSTPAMGAFIAKEAGVKRLVITHHAPSHNDARLRDMEAELQTTFKNAIFAREGELCYG